MPSTFSKDISKWVEKANGRVDLVFRKIALDLGTQVIYKTPVDTGRARNNWVMGVGQPAQSGDMSPVKFPDVAGKIPYIPSGKDVSVFWTNSVPYIVPLEYGSSKQAPEGMVRLTVAKFLGITIDAVTFAKGKLP